MAVQIELIRRLDNTFWTLTYETGINHLRINAKIKSEHLNNVKSIGGHQKMIIIGKSYEQERKFCSWPQSSKRVLDVCTILPWPVIYIFYWYHVAPLQVWFVYFVYLSLSSCSFKVSLFIGFLHAKKTYCLCDILQQKLLINGLYLSF